MSNEKDYYNWDGQELRDECGKRELSYPANADNATLIDILDEDDIDRIVCEQIYIDDDF